MRRQSQTDSGRDSAREESHSTVVWGSGRKNGIPVLFSIPKTLFCGPQTLEEIMLQTLLISFDSPAPCFAPSISELFLAYDFSVISRFLWIQLLFFSSAVPWSWDGTWLKTLELYCQAVIPNTGIPTRNSCSSGSQIKVRWETSQVCLCLGGDPERWRQSTFQHCYLRVSLSPVISPFLSLFTDDLSLPASPWLLSLILVFTKGKGASLSSCFTACLIALSTLHCACKCPSFSLWLTPY